MLRRKLVSRSVERIRPSIFPITIIFHTINARSSAVKHLAAVFIMLVAIGLSVFCPADEL